jgi:hypothetical protein
MGASFPISFRNGLLRAHRRKVLCEREKSLLPALQIYAEARRTMERLNKDKIEIYAKLSCELSAGATIGAQYRNLKNKQFVLEYNIRKQKKEIIRLKAITDAAELITVPTLLRNARNSRNAFREQEEEIQKELEIIQPQYLELKEANERITAELKAVMNMYYDKAPPAERREFIMRCPADECRGFLSTAYKCGTCEAWTCKECHVSVGKDKDAQHTCDPDTVLSAKAIKEETRPCPKCGTRIFKLIGCEQMWCVMEGCGTAFSWNTGNIVAGVIHNPHYYEWLRRKNGSHLHRETGDIPCGGMPGVWDMVGTIRDLEIPQELTTAVLETFRNMNEIVDHRLQEFPSRIPQLANKEDDIDYLLNIISEDVWQVRLERTETKFNRRREIGQILQTLATAGADMMNRIYTEARRATDEPEVNAADNFADWLLSVALPELQQLRTFGNESLLALAKRDRTAVPQFEENWSWKGLRAIYSTKSAQPVAEPTEIVEEMRS